MRKAIHAQEDKAQRAVRHVFMTERRWHGYDLVRIYNLELRMTA